ncbi:uncharacterized protein LOC132171667 [Corylus avellana]|uniref:uncharacterized protein LOC132171667 n=1 Tax=Corylus avellana TaxID=13451 RepID=UPI001E1EE864|nr:uncharacterized protein LOC132171667 [Corylus avellana]
MAANGTDDHHETMTKMMKPEGYPSSDDEEMEVYTSTTSESIWNSPFFSTHNDMSLLESGLLQGNMNDMGDNYYRFQAEHGEPVDPRLLSLLVYFRELFVESEQVFKKIFPGLHDEISELLQKFGSAISQVKSDRTRVRTMQRSLSIGSPRTLCRDGDLESPSASRLEYFKVRTVRINGIGQQGDQGSGGGGGGGSK